MYNNKTTIFRRNHKNEITIRITIRIKRMEIEIEEKSTYSNLEGKHNDKRKLQLFT